MFSPAFIAANFTRLDDSDILASAKYWADHSDPVLSDLAGRLIRRNLFAIELQNEPFNEERIHDLTQRAVSEMKIRPEASGYYVFTDAISNLTYAPDEPEVRILLKGGTAAGIREVSDMFNHDLVSDRVTKYFLCYPKELRSIKK